MGRGQVILEGTRDTAGEDKLGGKDMSREDRLGREEGHGWGGQTWREEGHG